MLAASSIGACLLIVARTLIASCTQSDMSLQVTAVICLLLALGAALYIVWISLESDFGSR